MHDVELVQPPADPNIQPMMTRQEYDRFTGLRSRMQARGIANLSQVFVPVGPRPTSAGTERRILFIGRATRVFDDPGIRTYDGAAQRAVETFIHYKSPYWTFLRRIVATAGSHLAAATSSIVVRHGWSNFTKIGDTRTNPGVASLSFQGAACCDALRAEIAFMRPHAIIVMTGSYAHAPIFQPVFGDHGWTPLTSDVRWKYDPASTAHVVHTYHPQQKVGSRDLSHKLGQLLAEALASHQAYHPLPLMLG